VRVQKSSLESIMPDVSLTDFVDFVNKTGPPRLTKVKEIKTRPEYSPAVDFWKPLREAIRDFHKARKPLDPVLNGIEHTRKADRYPAALSAYKKFLRRKEPEWFEPPSGLWTYSALHVRVNPELGLRLGGKAYVVKLYFKDEPLPRRRLAVVFQLMKIALADKLAAESTLAVLDVSNSKLLLPDPNAPDVTALLIGEAAAFVAMWNAI
jgi:hypothetical protein